MQVRPKEGKNKYYLKEEKLKIVQEMLNGKTTRPLEKITSDTAMIW